MSIQKITFKNYKSFEQEQVFEIKPITIVIGRNNSGKTALIQLPFMLHAWMQDRNGLLSTSFNGIEFAKQMKELVFNSDKDRCLEISFTPRPHMEVTMKIAFWGDECGISYLEWKYNDSTVWKAEKKENRYKVTTKEPNRDAKVEYVSFLSAVVGGILPSKEIILWEEEDADVDENGEPYLILLPRSLYNEATIAIQYFAGIRHTFPDANLSFNDLKYKTFDIKGEFAAHYLYKHSDLLEDVKTWYIKNMDGWGIGMEKNLYNEGFYLYLEDFTKKNGAKIPITQTGQGITQVLPLVTFALKKPKGLIEILEDSASRFMLVGFPKFIKNIIIEQPELHIHPAAHGNLVELFAESAIKSGNNYILETHSEVMILRIRRLVAEGKLSPEQVAIYWVDTEEGSSGKRSFLKKIEVDEEGMLSEWPEGVFSEDHEEVLAIRRAQRRREDARE